MTVGSAQYSGPFDLNDTGTLPCVTVAATETDLYLWTVVDASIASRSAGAVIPQLSAYPLGTKVARLSVPAPDPWPVNGEPALGLPFGDVVRFVYAEALERYSAGGGWWPCMRW